MAKLQYLWRSSDPKDKRVMAVAIAFGLIVNALCLFVFADVVQSGAPAVEQGLGLQSVKGLILVSLGWIFVVSSTTTGQVLIKEMGPESVQEVALRSLGNTLEYGVMSLMLIWLYGVYCNAMAATVFGGVYVVARLLYPVFYGMYGEFTLMVEFATQPGYFAKGYMLLGLMVMLFTGQDLIADVANLWYQPLVGLGGWLVYNLVFGMLVGFPLFLNFKRGAAWKERFDADHPPEEVADGSESAGGDA